jgi:hypothetical protein
MKKQLLLVFFAFTIGVSGLRSQNVIPNPSLEDWTTDTIVNMLGQPVPIEMPDNWISIQGLFGAMFGGTFNLAKTTDHHGTGANAAVITPGADSMGCDLIAMFPFTATPSKLSGYYKYQGTSANTFATVYVGMLKYNTVADSSEVIGGGFMVLNNMVSTYTLVEIPITFFAPITPDTAVIYVDYLMGAPGVKLFVDDFSFGYAAGVDELALQESFHVYPSPVTDVLNVRIDNALMKKGFDQVSVMDVTGKTVLNLRAGENHETIDMSALPKGFYMVRLTNGIEQTTRKIVKH